MSTSFPHGFLGFQGLTPSSINNTNSTNNNPRTNTTTTDISSTYQPVGPSPVVMASTMVNNHNHHIECCDSNQPLTCAVATSNDYSNDCLDDVPVSIAVPIGTSYCS